MKTRLILAAAMLAAVALNISAQVAVNDDGAAANSNAMLDVVSPATGDGKGLLIPRVSEAHRTAADSGLAGGLLDDSGDLRGGGAQGLTVYQTDGTEGFYYNTSSTATPSWTIITTGGAASTGDNPNTVVLRDGSGDFSAAANTAGMTNTFIGALADAASSGLMNAMAIGYDAEVDASNKVVIGNSSVNTIGGYANWSNYSDARARRMSPTPPSDLSFSQI